MSKRTKWPQWKVMRLLALNDGRSGSEIAQALGGDTSRAAVISKLHNMDLMVGGGKKAPVKPRKVSPLRPNERPRLNTVAIHSRTVGRTKAAESAQKSPIRVTRVAVEMPQPMLCVSMADLQEGMCRWPLGGFYEITRQFCGLPRVDGLPYCHDHNRIAYTPESLMERRAQRV